MQIKINSRLIDFSTAKVMGIVNLTPDSFYSASQFQKGKHLLQVVGKMLEDGAFMIDFGAYSTRPGAEMIGTEEEINRLSKGLESVLKEFPDILVSVDTFRAPVARHVVKEFGVNMINDISGGTLDPEMFETISDLGVAYVLMHMRGTPQNMQTLTKYDNIGSDVLAFLQKRVAQLHQLGVNDILIDPGFGFAKTVDQNYELLRDICCLKELNAPILAGFSRKSMIYKTLDTDAFGALNGTTALHMLALVNGVSVLRVHDVKEAMEVVKLYNKYSKV